MRAGEHPASAWSAGVGGPAESCYLFHFQGRGMPLFIKRTTGPQPKAGLSQTRAKTTAASHQARLEQVRRLRECFSRRWYWLNTLVWERLRKMIQDWGKNNYVKNYAHSNNNNSNNKDNKDCQLPKKQICKWEKASYYVTCLSYE